jgi:hypothetical protein
MSAFVDVQLVEGLALPYAPGAEAALADNGLDPLFGDWWEWLAVSFPGLSLQPLFDEIPVAELADLVDAVRFGGDEPPDPFRWFTLPCDDAIADVLEEALQWVPLFAYAGRRGDVYLVGPVSFGTNPQTAVTLQIQPFPHGIDAIYAWDVAGGTGAGVRVADLEFAWFLDHEDLITARIRKVSIFGTGDASHGTSVAGIVVGSDNGVGTVGIVPDAQLDLVTVNRPNGVNVAGAILAATAKLSRGDVLLIEVGRAFYPTPTGDIFVEFDPAVQAAIRLAVSRGITVIEPAGNGRVDLDRFPFLAHTRPEAPTFSGAIVVGAAVQKAAGDWQRTFSSFGSRVDCFAAGGRVRAPTSGAPDAYDPNFSGTSSASAIIAGVAASIQAMTRSATHAALEPADVRRLLRSAQLGTLPDDPLGARIGSMPDLRRIVQAQGLARVIPVAAAQIGGDALLVVHLDAENRMVRRHYTFFTGWGPPLPAPEPNDQFELTAAQPALLVAHETDPLLRIRYDAYFSGPGGVHHMWWDTLNQSGDISQSISEFSAVAQGRALGVALPTPDRVLIAAISPAARLVVMTGDPQVLLSGVSTPLVVDTVASYRRTAGPVVVSRSTGTVDIVMIEDGGGLNWYHGNLFATVGTGWSGRFSEPTSTEFVPGARPSLLAVGNGLLAAAVGADGWLRTVTLDPVTNAIETPGVVDVQATIDARGPVALVLAGGKVVVMAIDTEGTLRAAVRPEAGGDWSPLLPVPAISPLSPLGGVVAVPIDLGLMAIVIAADGTVHSALSPDGQIWSPLQPMP